MNHHTFPFDIWFITLFLIIFSIILCLFYYYPLFHKRFNNLFIVKLTNSIHSRKNLFNLCNHKNFYRPTWHVIICRSVLYFHILTWSPPLNLTSSFWFFWSKSVYVLDFISTGFILFVLWYLFLYSLTILSNLLIYIFLDIEIIYL